jgi:hypothetical protein
VGWLQFSNIPGSAVALIQWNQALLLWVVQIVAFWDVISCTCVVVCSPRRTGLGLLSRFWLIIFWYHTCILNPEDGGSVFSQNVGFWTLSVCLQAMKDKMNISRGRERDRTARQVRPHRLVGMMCVDWKMGKCKYRRHLMVWDLQDRGGTRLPLALLFTFGTIITLRWVQIIKIQIKNSQVIQELLFIKMENGRPQWYEVVICWLAFAAQCVAWLMLLYSH